MWGDAAVLGAGIAGGADTFAFAAGNGSDIVHDFELGKDVIEVGTGAAGFSELSISAAGADSVIDFGGGNSVVVKDTTSGGASLLGEADFVFV
jgi:hypothetical protein